MRLLRLPNSIWLWRLVVLLQLWEAAGIHLLSRHQSISLYLINYFLRRQPTQVVDYYSWCPSCTISMSMTTLSSWFPDCQEYLDKYFEPSPRLRSHSLPASVSRCLQTFSLPLSELKWRGVLPLRKQERYSYLCQVRNPQTNPLTFLDFCHVGQFGMRSAHSCKYDLHQCLQCHIWTRISMEGNILLWISFTNSYR